MLEAREDYSLSSRLDWYTNIKPSRYGLHKSVCYLAEPKATKVTIIINFLSCPVRHIPLFAFLQDGGLNMRLCKRVLSPARHIFFVYFFKFIFHSYKVKWLLSGLVRTRPELLVICAAYGKFKKNYIFLLCNIYHNINTSITNFPNLPNFPSIVVCQTCKHSTNHNICRI